MHVFYIFCIVKFTIKDIACFVDIIPGGSKKSIITFSIILTKVEIWWTPKFGTVKPNNFLRSVQSLKCVVQKLLATVKFKFRWRFSPICKIGAFCLKRKSSNMSTYSLSSDPICLGYFCCFLLVLFDRWGFSTSSGVNFLSKI